MSNPVEVDGSTGEGGGQVLRLAVAMAAATGKGLRIDNVRAGRKKPGLRAQHLAAVRAVAQLCGARLEGAQLGSGKLSMEPQRPPGGEAMVDVDTAGSVTLVLQAVLGALSAPGSGPGEVVVQGGTDVIMAPTWDYFANVLVPTLGQAGLDMELEMERRGFFPQGGGRVVARTEGIPSLMAGLEPRADRSPKIEGTIVWSQLPDHIPKRIDHAIRKELVDHDVVRVRKKHVEADCPGVAATLWADMGDAVLGASMVGRRGLPSEEIGMMLGSGLRADIEAGATVDGHLADQLVVHTALSEGRSVLRVRELSLHARTALGIARMFRDTKVVVGQDEGLDVVEIIPGGD